VQKLLITVFVGTIMGGCTQEVAAPTKSPAEPPSETPVEMETPAEEPAPVVPAGPITADNCIDGQDLNSADLDISKCPEIPVAPKDVTVEGKKVSLGAWEIGTTANKENYKYGTLSAPGTNPRMLSYDGGEVAVNAENLACWAKGYYLLRKILQAPPAEWLALKNAGFQYRFFQFQTDLRNGPTGYKQISSFDDHLVKWVTVIDAKGVCQAPTLAKFETYAKSEVKRRKLTVPPSN
jgi:hypothetical protein